MPDVPITPGAGVGVDVDDVTFALTGTVAKNATATVTGTTSAFLTDLQVGDVIRIPGGTSTEDRVVLNIASNTSLTVSVAFTTTASAQTGLRVAQRQVVQTGWASSATVTSPTSAAADTSLLAANIQRIGVLLYNDSTASCYVKYGTGASSTSYTVFMGPGAYWEMPVPIYTGAINGNWTVANGNMRVTELLP